MKIRVGISNESSHTREGIEAALRAALPDCTFEFKPEPGPFCEFRGIERGAEMNITGTAGGKPVNYTAEAISSQARELIHRICREEHRLTR